MIFLIVIPTQTVMLLDYSDYFKVFSLLGESSSKILTYFTYAGYRLNLLFLTTYLRTFSYLDFLLPLEVVLTYLLVL